MKELIMYVSNTASAIIANLTHHIRHHSCRIESNMERN